jgi:Tfp pilus assembly protein PilO
MKITPLQQYIILGVFAFLGVSFLYYQLLLKPENAKIVSLQSTLSDKKKELDEAKRIVSKYVEFKKRSDSIQRELEWIQNRIPRTITKPQLLEAISLVQDRSGVILTSFALSNGPVQSDLYTEIPAVIRFNASYEQLINFLYQVSASNLLMTVHDMTITALPNIGPNWIRTLSAQMTLSGIQAK